MQSRKEASKGKHKWTILLFLITTAKGGEKEMKEAGPGTRRAPIAIRAQDGNISRTKREDQFVKRTRRAERAWKYARNKPDTHFYWDLYFLILNTLPASFDMKFLLNRFAAMGNALVQGWRTACWLPCGATTIAAEALERNMNISNITPLWLSGDNYTSTSRIGEREEIITSGGRVRDGFVAQHRNYKLLHKVKQFFGFLFPLKILFSVFFRIFFYNFFLLFSDAKRKADLLSQENAK